jgi:hypothetical protein
MAVPIFFIVEQGLSFRLSGNDVGFGGRFFEGKGDIFSKYC